MKRIFLMFISFPIFLNANPLHEFLMQIKTKKVGLYAHQGQIPGGPAKYGEFSLQLQSLVQQNSHTAKELVKTLEKSKDFNDLSRFNFLTVALNKIK